VITPLDDAGLIAASRALAATDPILGDLWERNGPPPLWAREPGFATLIHLILEQQVSLASAAAAYERLVALVGVVKPTTVLGCDDDELRRAGFSRQKAAYARGLAERVSDGRLDLDAVDGMDDEAVAAALLPVLGIGPWTVDCYLIQALLRPDRWPHGDRALQVALGRVLDMAEVPDTATAARHAERWRPYRSVAARMLWHEYLGGPTNEPR